MWQYALKGCMTVLIVVLSISWYHVAASRARIHDVTYVGLCHQNPLNHYQRWYLMTLISWCHQLHWCLSRTLAGLALSPCHLCTHTKVIHGKVFLLNMMLCPHHQFICPCHYTTLSLAVFALVLMKTYKAGVRDGKGYGKEPCLDSKHIYPVVL